MAARFSAAAKAVTLMASKFSVAAVSLAAAKFVDGSHILDGCRDLNGSSVCNGSHVFSGRHVFLSGAITLTLSKSLLAAVLKWFLLVTFFVKKKRTLGSST